MAADTDKVKDVIEEGANIADRAITSAADKASNATRRARYIAEDAVDGGRDTIEGALLSAKDMIRANPITSIAVVAAISYFWGRMKW